MNKYKAEVVVRLKSTIKDIKAETLKQAVNNIMTVKNLQCSVGNIYKLEFEADSKASAENIIHTISEEILSNSVIEEYEIKW